MYDPHSSLPMIFCIKTHHPNIGQTQLLFAILGPSSI
jgi:hypothetical protein